MRVLSIPSAFRAGSSLRISIGITHVEKMLPTKKWRRNLMRRRKSKSDAIRCSLLRLRSSGRMIAKVSSSNRGVRGAGLGR